MDVLESLVIIFIASAVVVFLLNKLKVPSLVGFIVAGVIIGPFGAGIIGDTHNVEILAEIGVILLLFTIGIEFSVTKLLRMRKNVIAGGGLQMALSTIFVVAVASLVSDNVRGAVFFGFLVALSSTAIVMKILAETGETDSPHGRVMVGILIFQDLCVVPLMLFIPVLSGQGVTAVDVALKMGEAVLIIVAVLFSSRRLVPFLLYQVVNTRSRELFIITIIIVCMGIALLTSKFGLSLALGAFLAGLVISESEYAHQAISDVLPFKDSFIGLFFVSVGMLMNIGYVADHWQKVAGAVTGIFALKVLTGTAAPLLIGTALRTSFHAGLGLAQIGEFSFVLAAAGKVSGLITDDFYQVFLSASVLTMMATPFVHKAAPSVSAWIASRHLLKKITRLRKSSEAEGYPRSKRDHVIIVGFGLNGRNLARVLKETEIPYAVLEMNSDTVREMKKKGEPIYYGDGTSKGTLHKLGIARARLLVVAISDPVSTRRVVAVARQENPAIDIIVRTRYLVEIDDLKLLGATEIIPEEFETSIEIFARVLYRYNFPNNVIQDMIAKIRSDSYTALRGVELPQRHLFEKCEWIPEMEIEGYRIPSESGLAGRSISELQVRKKTGATIIAVRRGPDVHTNPEPDFKFRADDILLFTGSRDNMKTALSYFKEALS